MSSTTTPQLTTDAIDPDLVAGQVVGEYVVDGKLGQGGFGAVFRAAHPLIGKVVAIKVLSRRFSVDPEMVSRFVAEARAVNQIRHRNIIDIFSFGQLEDGRHYYVMEYLDGEPLDRRIKRMGQIPLAEAVPILRGLARALDAAHVKGIAHRDLKAENVFLGVDADGAVFPKLLDFGIAKLMGPEDVIAHKTRTGAPMGTPYYMSPEQCRGREVDHRTDLYAFGVLTYLVLAGAFPIDGDDYMTILMRQMVDDPPPLRAHVTGIPEGVDHVIAWLMHKEAAQRPPDLATAIRALEEAGGLPSTGQLASVHTPSGMVRIPASITGRPTAAAATATTPTPNPERRPRRWWPFALAGAVLVAGGATFAIVSSRGSGPAPRADAGVIATTLPPPVDAAPAPSPDAAVAAVVAPVDAGAATVTVEISGTPPGTEVKVGDRHVGTAPGAISLTRGEYEVVLTLTAPRYRPREIRVMPDRDSQQTVTLKPIGPTKTGRGSGSGKGSGSAFVPTDEIDGFPKN